MTLKISIIAPMYNEQEVISSFVEALFSIINLSEYQFEVLLIDDGSTDDTLTICDKLAKKDSRIKVLAFSRNYGHEIASTAGLNFAEGDYAILMDSDLQHPPSLIPKLINKALEGYDVVSAKRTNRDNESWLKRKTAQIFYKVASKMTGFQLDSDIGNYRILSRKVIDSLKQMKESNRHMLMLFAYIGYHATTIPFHCEDRVAGKSKYTYRKLFNLAVDSLVSFSHRPLRYMSILAICISVLCLGYAGFIVIQKLFCEQTLADGVASVILMISGLFSVLFLFLAVLSEYITRILVETKDRPLYYIKSISHYAD